MLREVGDDGLEGKVLGDRYQIDHELGRGAMGVVYRGHRIKDGRPVAIKVIHHRLLTTPTMSERFVREAELAAKLSHKNLVGVLDVGELPDGRRWIVLELARGPNLAEVIKHGPVAAPRAIAILRQLCDGLEHAHRAGLVHRDLKPANIVIECDAAGVEVPQIIDFGIAVIDDASERLTRSGLVLGTPAYMAPEQAAGGKLDHRCDQYALGAIAYEMLAGVAPFRGRGADVARAHVDQQVPPIAIRIDALLEAIIRKMLAKRPDDRFTNVRAVNQMLELLASDRNRAAALLGMPVGEHAIPARRRTPAAVPVVRPRRARWPWVAGAGVGVLAGAIVIAATWPASVPSTQAVHLRPITPAPAPVVPVQRVEPRDPIVVAPRKPPPRAMPVADPTAQQVVDRYKQVASRLQQATARKAPGSDVQTTRFRVIRISEALRTPPARREAMRVLDAIDRALP